MKQKHMISIAACVLMTTLLFTGCADMTNAKVSSQEEIDSCKSTIEEFATNNEYDLEFSKKKLLEDTAIEGEILLDKERGWLNFYIKEDGVVNLYLFVRDKSHLEDYLDDIISLSNTLSKRQFTLAEIKEFLESDEYLKTEDTDYIYKHKDYGWWSDSSVSYSQRGDTALVELATGFPRW